MMSLREMQMLAEAVYSVESTRKTLNKLVDYFLQREEHLSEIEAVFCRERQLPLSTAKACKCFFLNEGTLFTDIPEEFRHDSFGFVKDKYVVFEGRLVYPILDVNGDAMGFCGWDKFAQGYKYMDSKNYGYMAKKTTLYGMECLEDYYRSNEKVFVVEGIVCCLYLRSIGLSALATLGSSLSPYVTQMLSRLGERLVMIPDNDEAGNEFVKRCKCSLPKATVIQSILAKDIDDSRKVDEQTLIQELKAISNPFTKFNTIRVR